MKKVVLKYGFISGGIAAALMLIYSTFMEKISFDKGYLFGYTFIILSFVPIYFGILHLKNNTTSTRPTFLKYLGTGLLIAVISSACYALMWTILYYTVFPDFIEKYNAQMIALAQKSKDPAKAMKNVQEQMEQFRNMYKTPLSVFFWTFLIEPLPVGILISFIAAIIVKLRK
jgi:hypothetical protein